MGKKARATDNIILFIIIIIVIYIPLLFRLPLIIIIIRGFRWVKKRTADDGVVIIGSWFYYVRCKEKLNNNNKAGYFIRLDCLAWMDACRDVKQYTGRF